MTDPKFALLPWLHSFKVRRAALFALSLVLTYFGYNFWQIVAAFVWFFSLGTGAGHDDQGILIEVGFLAVHVGLLSWFFRRRVLYTTWLAWTANVGLSISLFTYLVFYPWYSSPRDPTYQTYTFVRGSLHYKITLEQPPGNSFDLSDVTNRKNGFTVSLMMGNYVVRHDTVFIQEFQGPRQWLIYHDTLVGFENSTIPIRPTQE